MKQQNKTSTIGGRGTSSRFILDNKTLSSSALKEEIKRKYNIWNTSAIRGSSETKDGDEWMCFHHVVDLIRKTQEAIETELGTKLLKKFGIESISSYDENFDDLLRIVYEELEIVVKDNMKLRSLQELEELQSKIKGLQKQINCVKNHPEIKPLNCCWHADSLEYREYKRLTKNKIKELENDKESSRLAIQEIHKDLKKSKTIKKIEGRKEALDKVRAICIKSKYYIPELWDYLNKQEKDREERL